ncbi:hypothetical protein CO670_15010 [Rhizobium sp. J15]|uniref:hypothetical protein n=1 Tax=Rhizobium sp. J15 TaxID=2035450 RepID=UPI000BEA7475|nr:hypothetical protein [Rhizobium sp. J15]PDT16089.1 hypothetical protein CO670_15010 [Rhizobium sp. J15]
MINPSLSAPHKGSVIASQIELLQKYLASGRSRELYSAIKGVCTERTLRNWLSNPQNAEKAPLVKNGALDRIIATLHEKDSISYYDNYRFSLGEMRAGEDTQYGLTRYVGTYQFYSNIPAALLGLNQIRIKIVEPFIPVFSFRMLSDNVYRKCDGFIFDSGGKIFFTGLAEYVNTSIVIAPVVNPTKDNIRGIITIQNKMTQQCFVSSCLLIHSNAYRPSETENYKKKLGSIYEML